MGIGTLVLRGRMTEVNGREKTKKKSGRVTVLACFLLVDHEDLKELAVIEDRSIRNLVVRAAKEKIRANRKLIDQTKAEKAALAKLDVALRLEQVRTKEGQ
jgi:hypothetical protein